MEKTLFTSISLKMVQRSIKKRYGVNIDMRRMLPIKNTAAIKDFVFIFDGRISDILASINFLFRILNYKDETDIKIV
jgi:hypothetical protein